MKRLVPMFDNSGARYSIPEDRVDEFRADMGEVAEARRYRDKDGRHYTIPQDQDEAFRADMPDAVPVRSYTMADGTRRDFTMSEMSKFLRSKEYRESKDNPQNLDRIPETEYYWYNHDVDPNNIKGTGISINPADYDTKLTPEQERGFQAWRAKLDRGLQYDGDYDLRGAYLDNVQSAISDSDGKPHMSDKFKKPNHKTFSVHSKYAKDFPELAGDWDGNSYILPKAEIDLRNMGSPTFAGVKGALTGAAEGAYYGGKNALAKVATALPEAAASVGEAVGNAVNLGGNAKNPVGDWLRESGRQTKRWLGENIRGDKYDEDGNLVMSGLTKDLGYEDTLTKIGETAGDAAAMAVKFAPAAVAGPAYMETILASDGINAFADTFDRVKAAGYSDAQANLAGTAAGLINYYGAKLMMKGGAATKDIANPLLRALAGTAFTGAATGAQAVGNKGVENVIEGKPITEGMLGAAGEGFVEGAQFHLINEVGTNARPAMNIRRETREMREMRKQNLLTAIETPEGRAFVDGIVKNDGVDDAIRARKEGKDVSRRMGAAADLPDNMSAAERNAVIDGIAKAREAQAERVRTKMDDVQAQSLADEIGQNLMGGASDPMFEDIWLNATRRVKNAAELDEPGARARIVGEAIEDVVGKQLDAGPAKREAKSYEEKFAENRRLRTPTRVGEEEIAADQEARAMGKRIEAEGEAQRKAAAEKAQADYDEKMAAYEEARAKRAAEKKRGIAKEKLTPLPEKPEIFDFHISFSERYVGENGYTYESKSVADELLKRHPNWKVDNSVKPIDGEFRIVDPSFKIPEKPVRPDSEASAPTKTTENPAKVDKETPENAEIGATKAGKTDKRDISHSSHLDIYTPGDAPGGVEGARIVKSVSGKTGEKKFQIVLKNGESIDVGPVGKNGKFGIRKGDDIRGPFDTLGNAVWKANELYGGEKKPAKVPDGRGRMVDKPSWRTSKVDEVDADGKPYTEAEKMQLRQDKAMTFIDETFKDSSRKNLEAAIKAFEDIESEGGFGKDSSGASPVSSVRRVAHQIATSNFATPEEKARFKKYYEGNPQPSQTRENAPSGAPQGKGITSQAEGAKPVEARNGASDGEYLDWEGATANKTYKIRVKMPDFPEIKVEKPTSREDYLRKWDDVVKQIDEAKRKLTKSPPVNRKTGKHYKPNTDEYRKWQAQEYALDEKARRVYAEAEKRMGGDVDDLFPEAEVVVASSPRVPDGKGRMVTKPAAKSAEQIADEYAKFVQKRIDRFNSAKTSKDFASVRDFVEGEYEANEAIRGSKEAIEIFNRKYGELYKTQQRAVHDATTRENELRESERKAYEASDEGRLAKRDNAIATLQKGLGISLKSFLDGGWRIVKRTNGAVPRWSLVKEGANEYFDLSKKNVKKFMSEREHAESIKAIKEWYDAEDAKATKPSATEAKSDGKGRMVTKPAATKAKADSSAAKRAAATPRELKPLKDAIAEAKKSLADKKGVGTMVADKQFSVNVGTMEIKFGNTAEGIARAEKIAKKLSVVKDWMPKDPSNKPPSAPKPIKVASGKDIGTFDDVAPDFLADKKDWRKDLKDPFVKDGYVYATDGRSIIRMKADVSAKNTEGAPDAKKIFDANVGNPVEKFKIDASAESVPLEQARAATNKDYNGVEIWRSPDGKIVMRSRTAEDTRESNSAFMNASSLKDHDYLGTFDPDYIEKAFKTFAKLGVKDVDVEWSGATKPLYIHGGGAEVLIMPLRIGENGVLSADTKVQLLGGRRRMTDAQRAEVVNQQIADEIAFAKENNPKLTQTRMLEIEDRIREAEKKAQGEIEKHNGKLDPMLQIDEATPAQKLADPDFKAWARKQGRTPTDGARRIYDAQRVDAVFKVAKNWLKGVKMRRSENAAEVPQGARMSIGNLYTGSAADYEKPSLLKVGTGEGSQVYGWGLYASDQRGVAEEYAKKSASKHYFDKSKRVFFDGKEVEFGFTNQKGSVADLLSEVRYHSSVDGAIKEMESELKKYGPGGKFENERVFNSLSESLSFIKKNKDRISTAPKYGNRLYEQTFFTNRAPGDESHLLKWYEPVSEENWKRIISEARKEFDNGSSNVDPEYLEGIKANFSVNDGGRRVYEALSDKTLFGSPKAASEFLARADIDGIKYPVDSYGGKTVKDGDKAGWNYVSFRDDNITVDHKWVDGKIRYLYSRDGNVVGWYDRAKKEVVTLPGADAATVAHELGWHATYDYAQAEAAQGRTALLDKLNDYAANAPQAVKNEILRKYGMATDAAVLLDEIGAARYTMDNVNKIKDAATRRQTAKWYQRTWNAIADTYKAMLSKLGWNKARLDNLSALTPEETVNLLADEMLKGRNLGKAKSTQIDMSKGESIAQLHDRKLKDRFHPIEEIEKDTGKSVGNSAYTLFRTLPGKVQKAINEAKAFEKKVKDECKKAGIKTDEINELLYASAAPERNAKVLSRNGRLDGSAMSHADIQRILSAYRNSPKYAAMRRIADMALALQKKGFDFRRDAGLISYDTWHTLSTEEPNHVPMKNRFDPNGEHMGFSLTEQFGKPEWKTAEGRTNVGDGPLEWIVQEYVDAFSRGHENIARRALLETVLAHPEVGEVKKLGPNDALGEVKRKGQQGDPNVFVVKTDGDTYQVKLNGTRGELIARAVSGRGLLRMDWTNAKIPHTEISVRNAMRWWSSSATSWSPTFALRNFLSDTIDVFAVNIGEKGLIKGLGASGKHVKTALKLTNAIRKYASTGETTNPLIREAVDAGVLMGGGVRSQAFADAGEAALKTLKTDWRNGKNRIKAVRDFMFGWIDTLNQTAELMNRMADYKLQMDSLSKANNALPQNRRRSLAELRNEAALHAREITVDFNEKGELTPVTNMLYMFSNSTLGATMRLNKAIFASKEGKSLAAGTFALGLIEGTAEALANGDDEDGKNMNEYTRANSFYFRKGKDIYRIPLHASPISVIKYAGNCTARKLFGTLNGDKAAEQIAKDMIGMMTSFLGIGALGDNEAASIAPTIIQPFLQAYMNRDFADRPIERTSFSEEKPKSGNGRPSTPQFYHDLAKWLNEFGGGNAGRKGEFLGVGTDFSPEMLKHFAEATGKNALRDIENTVEFAKMVLGKTDWERRNIPVGRDYFRTTGGNDNRFFEAVRAYKTDASDFKERTGSDRKKFEDSHPWLKEGRDGKTTVNRLINMTNRDKPRDGIEKMGITQLRKLIEGKIRRNDGTYFKPNTPVSDELKEKTKEWLQKRQARVIEIMGK